MTRSADQGALGDTFRCADVELLSGGDGLLLAYRGGRATRYYRPEQVEVLLACRTFAKLDQHVHAICTLRPEMPRLLVEKQLRQFLRDGLMLHKAELLGPSAAAPKRTSVSTVAIPTIGRADPLDRCLTTYSANALQHGHDLRYLVLDDSKDEETGQRCRAIARSVAKLHRLRLDYVGASEKASYVRRLAEQGVDDDLAAFALLGFGSADQPTIGANRNCLLLATAGESVLSVDDDTVCVTARPPGYRTTVTLADDPALELWPFASRDEAFLAADDQQIDLVGAHASLLSRAPRDVLTDADQQGLADVDGPDARLLELALGQAVIRVTASGVVGDCGWDSSDFLMFQTASSRVRIDAAFTKHPVGRDMIQAAQRTVLTPAPDPKFAMCMGLDNSTLLPPFPPWGRGEEAAFAAVTAACVPDAWGAQVPCLVRHDPPARRFAERNPFELGLAGWLPMFLEQYAPLPFHSQPQRLQGLGRFLQDLGQLQTDDFDDLVGGHVRHVLDGLAHTLESDDDALTWFRSAARRLLGKLRTAAAGAPERWYEAAGGRNRIQVGLELYGRLLASWQDVMDAAARLEHEGRGLVALPHRSH